MGALIPLHNVLILSTNSITNRKHILSIPTAMNQKWYILTKTCINKSPWKVFYLLTLSLIGGRGGGHCIDCFKKNYRCPWGRRAGSRLYVAGCFIKEKCTKRVYFLCPNLQCWHSSRVRKNRPLLRLVTECVGREEEDPQHKSCRQDSQSKCQSSLH